MHKTSAVSNKIQDDMGQKEQLEICLEGTDKSLYFTNTSLYYTENNMKTKAYHTVATAPVYIRGIIIFSKKGQRTSCNCHKQISCSVKLNCPKKERIN